MFKNKKAQGLTLNTIVIAAIVLVVLVVLVMIFTGRMGWFNIGLFNATSEKECPHPQDELPCDPGYRLAVGRYSNVGAGQHCCVPETT